MKILLVEDDFDLGGALVRVLSKRGFDVSRCSDGLAALEWLRASTCDVVLLDLGLPGMDGLQLLQRMRGRGDATPVLVLTARGAVGDRVAGLNAGADDYLAKPFDIDELEARVRALARRSHAADMPHCGALRHDRASGAFYIGTQALDLTPREGALLAALIACPGHAVAKERLTTLAFGQDLPAQSDAIEVVVHRVRKKLVGTGVGIMTLRGVGYLLQEG